MKTFLILALVLAAALVHAQSGSLLNKPAPALTFASVLNGASASATLADYRSKIVILEFWATWCAPCIEAFPHLESLQKKFGGRVQVLAVTDETEERITRFLQKRTLPFPVVLDATKKIAETFPHQTIPHTVVIDGMGIVRAITLPDRITENVLQQLMDGKPVALEEKNEALAFDPSKPLSGNANFTYQVTMTPYQAGVPSMINVTGGEGGYKGRRIVVTNMSPKALYEVAYRYPMNLRTVVEVKNRDELGWSKQTALCFDVIVPAELGEQRFDIMKQHLDLLLRYQVSVEKRARKVSVLRAMAGRKPALKVASGTVAEYSSGSKGLEMKNGGMSIVADFLESQLETVVVDETQLAGLYDVTLPWYSEDATRVHAELNKLGLELAEATRDIEVLVIKDKE